MFRFSHMHIRNDSYEVQLKDLALLFTAGHLVGIHREGSIVAIFSTDMLDNSISRKHAYQWRSPTSYQYMHLPEAEFERHVSRLIGLQFQQEAKAYDQPEQSAAGVGVVDD